MATFERDLLISCPPEAAFAVLLDIDRLPELTEMTVAVRNTPGRPLQVGDRFEQVVKVVGVEVDTDWEVTELVPGSRLRVEGRSTSNGRASLTEHVTAEGDGCRVTLAVDYDPPLGLLGEIADKLVFERRHEEEAEQILANLKARCEAPSPAR